MKTLASLLLVVGGAIGLCLSIVYTALLSPWAAFGGETGEIKRGYVYILASVASVGIGLVLKRLDARAPKDEKKLSAILQRGEDDLKKRANERKL